jgi:hypothetical protein
MEKPAPLPQHQWLANMVGTWDFVSTCTGPDGSTFESVGVETVRAVGELWVVAETQAPVHCGEEFHHYIISLGFDPGKNQFVGSFISSHMPMMWHYHGELDASGTAIALDSRGPSMDNPEGEADYVDTYRNLGPDERELVSAVTLPDGNKVEFMKTAYRRRS